MNIKAFSRSFAPVGALLVAFAGGCGAQLPAKAAPLDIDPSVRPPVGLAGLDPYDTRCASDAVTASKAEVRDALGNVVASVELRRSERCKTSWARAVRVSPAQGALVASVRGEGRTCAFEHATDGEVWTDMVPSSRGCATATGGIRREDGTLQDARAAWCNDAGAVGVIAE